MKYDSVGIEARNHFLLIGQHGFQSSPFRLYLHLVMFLKRAVHVFVVALHLPHAVQVVVIAIRLRRGAVELCR